MKRNTPTVALALLLAGFTTTPSTAAQNGRPDPKALQAEAARGNRFAWDLYSRLGKKPGNLFFSPYSIRTALAMTCAGARGRTATQMRQVLALGGSGDKAHRILGLLRKQLNALSTGKDYQLHLANSLWAQGGTDLLPAFLRVVQANYGSTLERVDFAGKPEPSRLRINRWVSAKTDKRITELLDKEAVDASTRLVLINTILCRGVWPVAFDPKKTRKRPFAITPAKPVPVPFMARNGRFGHHQGDGVSVLEMPFRGKRLSMVILLPTETDGLARLESALSARTLDALLGKLQPRKVRILLPRFTQNAKTGLKRTLMAMGMTDAFSGSRADLSGMTGTRGLFINDVIHQANLEVDEKGATAAAATAVVVSKGAPPRITLFRADHPFLLLIRDRATGTILFLGRLTDPT